MTMAALSQDIAFRVRLALDTSIYDVPLSCYKLKRLEDILTLKSAHNTSSIHSGSVEKDSVELPRTISNFITYFIRKVYIGSNMSGNSNSISRRRDREMDMNNFKLFIDMYAPNLEEASLVYHVAGDAGSFAEIRKGLQNAEAASTSTVKVVLESADASITPMNIDNGESEVIDFVLSLTYGARERKIDREECSQEGSEVEESEVEESEEAGSEEEGSEDDVDSEGDSQEETNNQMGNDDNDELESKEADSGKRYPSK